MKKKSSIGLFVLLVFIIPATAFAIFNFYERKIEKLPVLGPQEEINGKKTEHQISEFHLTNQDGEIKSTTEWNNKIIIADFFFTRCPSICPKLTASLKKVNDYFKNDDEIKINSFSVDPGNDSAAQLKKYALRFGLDTKKWDLLTGDKREIYKLARNSFMIVATDGDGGPTDFIHSEKIILVDKQKRIRGFYDGTDEAEMKQLLTDIKKLKDED